MKKLAAVFTALLMLVAGAAVSAGCGDTRETFDGVVESTTETPSTMRTR